MDSTLRISKLGMGLTVLLLLVLLIAWIDGGEEPLRPIEQPVELPEGAL